jgi:cell division protein FtsW (lipid II flippase)
MIVDGVLSLYWPPMHLRGAEFTLTDTMHIVWAMVTVLLMMLAIGFGAAAFDKRFRAYSIATMVILVVFGALTGMDGPRIAANLPTPWVGVWERISIVAFLLWVVVLAFALLRAQLEQPRDGLGGGRDSG